MKTNLTKHKETCHIYCFVNKKCKVIGVSEDCIVSIMNQCKIYITINNN